MEGKEEKINNKGRGRGKRWKDRERESCLMIPKMNKIAPLAIAEFKNFPRG